MGLRQKKKVSAFCSEMAVVQIWPLWGAFNKSKVYGSVYDRGEKYRGSTADMEGQGRVKIGRLVQGGGRRVQMQG